MNKVSINAVLSDILLELPTAPTTQELIRIKRYIEKACKLLKVTKTLDVKVIEMPIQSNRTILPKDAITLLSVWTTLGDCNTYKGRLKQASNEGDYLFKDEYELRGNTLFVGDNCLEKVYVKITRPELDCDGFWLIPDNSTLHEAIYWFVVTKLIGSGYKGFPFQHNYANEMYERIHGPRAVEELKRFTPEDAETLRKQETKLIWDYDKWYMFGQHEQENFSFTGNYY